MSLAMKPVYSGRTFLSAPYSRGGDDDRLRPVRPERCPADGDSRCRIWSQNWRDRKRGPGYALAVFRCRTHLCIFTVYPPDWTPYARRSFVALSPDGADGFHDGGVRLAWASTVFQAVVDAAEGKAWPQEARFIVDERGFMPGGVFRTQCRHIEGALGLFAINEEADRRCQEKVAALFGIGVPLLVQIAGSRDGPFWKRGGEAGARVLDFLGAPGRRHFRSLVDLGGDRKYWGPCHLLANG